jgi:hypothetical protein
MVPLETMRTTSLKAAVRSNVTTGSITGRDCPAVSRLPRQAGDIDELFHHRKHRPSDSQRPRTLHRLLTNHQFNFAQASLPPDISFIIRRATTPLDSTPSRIKEINMVQSLLRNNGWAIRFQGDYPDMVRWPLNRVKARNGIGADGLV